MCRKLITLPIVLTKEEFLIRKENILRCTDFNVSIWLIKPLSAVYNIYHEPTAKYINSNIREEVEKEFRNKWY